MTGTQRPFVWSRHKTKYNQHLVHRSDADGQPWCAQPLKNPVMGHWTAEDFELMLLSPFRHDFRACRRCMGNPRGMIVQRYDWRQAPWLEA